MRFLEVAVFNYESAVIAKQAGVDRIEVCENYPLGGFTPSYDYVNKCIKLQEIDVFIMIRQPSDNFIFNIDDMKVMLKDVETYKKMNVNGFVFGALTNNKNVNIEFSKEIVLAASPLPVTFHRAFDSCNDLNVATENIINCGFKRILTSGGKKNADEGKFIIKDLIEKYSNDIIFIPGGGIRANNVSEIQNITGAVEFHSAGIRNEIITPNPNILLNDLYSIKHS